MSSENEWSNSKKWWMDLLKSVISFFIIASLTIFIIDTHNSEVEEIKSRFKHQLSTLEQTADLLEESIIDYYGSAYDAYLDRSSVNGVYENNKKPSSVIKYEDDSFDQIKLSMAKVESRYPEFVGDINAWREANSEMHRIYKTLSRFTEFNKVRKESRNLASEIVMILRIKHQSIV